MVSGANPAGKAMAFSRVKLGKSRIKVPKLKARPRRQKFVVKRQPSQIPVSVLVNMLIKKSLEDARKESEKKAANSEERTYRVIKEDKDANIGGYGATSRSYGAIQAAYTDYEKIFSHIGKFRAKGMYESLDNSTGQTSGEMGFSLASVETMDKAASHIKYFRPSGREFGIAGSGIDIVGNVPVAGMDGAEWAEFKMWFLLDKVAYYLKRKTA